ncbi:hypothetical protein [Paludibaculum fermentans]|uniref:hypothetical protein n=1 Tax=Paludibaculum fermentans TaxID=1473598 RepID=UPI003EBA7AFF
MNSILARFEVTPRTTFRPKTATELFALRLASRLNDTDASGHYLGLLERFSEAELLAAYRRTTKPGLHGDVGRRYQTELRHSQGSGPLDKDLKLIAVRVERRSVAVAVLYGDRLEYVQVRQLSSVKDKALGSAVSFVEWVCDQFRLDSAALESISIEDEIQRKAISTAITQVFRDRLIPIWEIPKVDLLTAYGHPRLKSRKELRAVITGIWPSLEGTNSKVLIQDAVALGLYVQTERLFIIN